MLWRDNRRLGQKIEQAQSGLPKIFKRSKSTQSLETTVQIHRRREVLRIAEENQRLV